MNDIKIGILGGSGLYDLPDLKVIDKISLKTPFGEPSDQYTIIEVDGIKAVFLPRHSSGHRLLPSEIPVKANIFGFKLLGVNKLISISAVGSLKEEIPPEHFVIPDQIIDRTKSRPSTFFGDGIVGHIGFGDPFCNSLSKILGKVLDDNNINNHKGGTYTCMEGPAFSTRAESNLYRSWGASVIGMTAIPESKLAREAEICYAMIAMSTDYDCWKTDEKDVTVDMVIKHMINNTNNVKKIIPEIIKKCSKHTACEIHDVARYSILTAKNKIPENIKKKLKPLYGKYFE